MMTLYPSPTVKQTETGTLVLRRVVKKTDDKKGTIAFITNISVCQQVKSVKYIDGVGL